MVTPTEPRLTLVLGGARSGKSRYAEGLLADLPPSWTYIATAEAYDDEMRARIAAHRARRDERWCTLDAPRDLPKTIRTLSAGQPALIDCLTLWLSNIMLSERDVDRETANLLAALRDTPGPVVVVSNEVGFGIVPDNPLARRFRDAQGRLNAEVAQLADRVLLVAAGLPLTLK